MPRRMQIVHRISLESSAKIRRELASMDIVVAAEGLIMFEVDEGRARWPELEGTGLPPIIGGWDVKANRKL